MSEPAGFTRANATVAENRQLAPGVHVLVLRAPGWATATRPGQFAMIRPPGTEPLLARPMAFMTADAEHASFGMKVVGRGTDALSRVVPGQELVVWGPLGRGFAAASPSPRKHVLVGGGIGVPPLVMQAAALAAAGTPPAEVIVGARSARELFGRERFQAMNVAARVCTDDGSEGHKGFVTDLLAKVPLGPDTLVQACGPTPMLIAVARMAAAAGAACEVSLEARMGCGVGACRGCMIPVEPVSKSEPANRFAGREYLCLCLDGPVVDARDVDLVRLGGIH